MKTWITITGCLALSLYAGCSAITMAKMEVPQVPESRFEHHPLEKMSPKLRGKNYRLGLYRIQILKGSGMGLLSGWGSSSSGNEYQKLSADFLFSVEKDHASPLQSKCSISYHQGKLSLGVGALEEEHGRLACSVRDENQSSIASLELYAGNNSKEGHNSGKIKVSNATWSIFPTFRREGSKLPDFDPTGFLIKRDGKLIGAVDTMNNGGFYLETSESEMAKHILASAAFAIIRFSKSTGI